MSVTKSPENKLLGWLLVIPLQLSNLALKLVGLLVVPVAALFSSKTVRHTKWGPSEGGEDQWHFPKWAFLWDNYHDPNSHGIDGRNKERERISNPYLRRVYWAALRNTASNYGTMVLGFPAKISTVVEQHGSIPDNLSGISGIWVGYAKLQTSSWLRPMLYYILDYGNGKCFYLKYGWKVFKDVPEDDTMDWIGLTIDIHPFRELKAESND